MEILGEFSSPGAVMQMDFKRSRRDQSLSGRPGRRRGEKASYCGRSESGRSERACKSRRCMRRGLVMAEVAGN